MGNNARWLTIHYIDNISDELWKTEEEKLISLAKQADVVFLYLTKKTFNFLTTQLIQHLSGNADIVCLAENISIEANERKTTYDNQRNWISHLMELQKSRKIGRIICTILTADYKDWQEDPSLNKRVNFFFHLSCEITSFKIKKLPLLGKKHFFITYHRWYNPQITSLNKIIPILIVESAGHFPTRTYVELINQSFCYIHSSPIGGMRSLNASLSLQTPTIIYLSQYPYHPNINALEDCYLIHALNLIHPNEWRNYLKVFTSYDELVAFLNHLLFAKKQSATKELESILLKQNKWTKMNEENINPYILWERWLNAFGYPLPAELTPITHILPSYLGDNPEVYKNLFPPGPWDKSDFSLNYPNLQSTLRNIRDEA